MVELTKAIVKRSDLPVTVKTRLGWDDNTKYIEEVAESVVFFNRIRNEVIARITRGSVVIHHDHRIELLGGDNQVGIVGALRRMN